MIAECIVIGYLLGSIPVAWILTKLVTDQDIRKMGSGNVGVMNVMLSVSRWAGLLVFLAEAIKGILAVVIGQAFGGGDIVLSAGVLATVIGTRWPVWLCFRGGRGNTAAYGALLALSWPTLFVGFIIWNLLRRLTGSSFWATRVSFLLGPLILGVFTQSWMFGLLCVPLSLVYLLTQDRRTDDHLIIKERWSSFWTFLRSPRRHRE